MSYELIYDLSSHTLVFYSFLIPALFGFFLSLFVFYFDKKIRGEGGDGIKNSQKIIIFIMLLSIFFTTVFFYGRYSVYKKYRDGYFSVVEGEIELFSPKTKPREMEVIVVDGVKISYSRGVASSGGFYGGQKLYDKIKIGKKAKIYIVDGFIVRFELEK